jgi:hypothetical protein
MKIEYTGKFPNKCCGNLYILIDDKKYVFSENSLQSGGSINFDNEKPEIKKGNWQIKEWPEDLKNNIELQQQILDEINKAVELGCCGGCILENFENDIEPE